MNPPTSHWHILIIGIYFNTMTWHKVKLYTVSNPTEGSYIIIYISKILLSTTFILILVETNCIKVFLQ